ncbi:MarR family winged helix-turn-helix transcriptional regulator [Streptomyces luteolus]|uniref:MarR family transcriptional regulator n=1 Tax=Streptomyces luteolus TaxID=3043615 RepID=A0ABT6T7R5_9ACTN|nr:MarR family transcriptional regulator [Streptomyces sp. B-S-A12]MDI3423936.1 MarR family transcriptional regulator [Streptomyces sp. B-S-A12]
MSDAVDAIIGQWTAERPDLAEAIWPVEVLARVQRMAMVLSKEVKTFSVEHGLEMGEFDVLTTLRRSGPPYALTAGAFLKAAMVTSGAITNRIDKMETKGLVERVRDGSDRRTVKIRLTDKGLALTDQLMDDHLANYARIAKALTPEDCAQVADGLRKLLEAHGDTSIT